MTNQTKRHQASQPAFHVELHPVPTDGRPFHALHGAVPAAPVPHLPSQIEDAVAQPLTLPLTGSPGLPR